MNRGKKKQVKRRGSLLKRNPFADLKEAHRLAAKRDAAMPYAQRVEDWIHVKRSTNGSSSPKKKVILALPVSGTSIAI
jgi:hypothetical protein